MTTSSELVFVHVSDIHFRQLAADGRSTIESDLRNEVLRDLRRLKLEHCTGVLISGDVAYSATTDEYNTATKWLAQVAEEVHCPEESVWMVPGNHDIDRTAIKDSPILMDIQRIIRTAPPADIDAQIAKYVLEEKLYPDMLFGPLQNYLSFASQYSCHHKPNQPIWTDDLTLNDGSCLRLVGLNSTLVSNSLDDDGANRLVLGTAQLQFPRIDGVEYMTLCHHPPQWLRDTDPVEDKLVQRVRIQLFGHKHVQRCREIDQKAIRLVAGAMFPEVREPEWNPVYNVLRVCVEGSRSDRHMNVTVEPRAWDKAHLQFGPDAGENNGIRKIRLKLDAWEPLKEEKYKEASQVVATPAVRPTPLKQEDTTMNTRRITYRFLTLPYTKQIEVAQAVGLLEVQDKGLQDQQLFQRFFARARTLNVIGQLESEIEKAHGANVSTS